MAMMIKTPREALFKQDGTLRYLSYCKASGRRGAVLSVSCGPKGIHTALMLDGYDFAAVYRRGCELLAEAFGAGDTALLADMLLTGEAFLAKNGLQLVTVQYQHAQPKAGR